MNKSLSFQSSLIKGILNYSNAWCWPTFEGLLSGHGPNLGHLFLWHIFLGLAKQEATHGRFMILFASDVAKQIDAAKAAANQADRQLAELEWEDGDDCEEDPHDGYCIAAYPEDKWVYFACLPCLS